ncbi:hypothetical protein CXU20_00220 [Akkermansia muciniphila]|nr:hypothetical protein CXU20_00220 [Akkermansia muciniphila]
MPADARAASQFVLIFPGMRLHSSTKKEGNACASSCMGAGNHFFQEKGEGRNSRGNILPF